jgi:hypothetical protein
MIAVVEQLLEQPDVLGISPNETIARVPLTGLLDFAVLGEVVEAQDLVTAGQELLDKIASDEAGRTRDQDLHEDPSLGLESYKRPCI